MGLMIKGAILRGPPPLSPWFTKVMSILVIRCFCTYGSAPSQFAAMLHPSTSMLSERARLDGWKSPWLIWFLLIFLHIANLGVPLLSHFFSESLRGVFVSLAFKILKKGKGPGPRNIIRNSKTFCFRIQFTQHKFHTKPWVFWAFFVFPTVFVAWNKVTSLPRYQKPPLPEVVKPEHL